MTLQPNENEFTVLQNLDRFPQLPLMNFINLVSTALHSLLFYLIFYESSRKESKVYRFIFVTKTITLWGSAVHWGSLHSVVFLFPFPGLYGIGLLSGVFSSFALMNIWIILFATMVLMMFLILLVRLKALARPERVFSFSTPSYIIFTTFLILFIYLPMSYCWLSAYSTPESMKRFVLNYYPKCLKIFEIPSIFVYDDDWKFHRIIYCSRILMGVSGGIYVVICQIIIFEINQQCKTLSYHVVKYHRKALKDTLVQVSFASFLERLMVIQNAILLIFVALAPLVQILNAYKKPEDDTINVMVFQPRRRKWKEWRNPDTSETKDIESTLPYDIIKWEMVSGGNLIPFQIIIYHLWYNFGSSHLLLGHFENFGEILIRNQRIIMENIKTTHKKLFESGVPKQVQPMITEREVMFKHLGKKKFIPHFINIMNGSTQKFFEMKEDKVILIMRCKVINEEDRFWSATFSDGTRHNLYESDGMLKLITFHRRNADKVEEEMKEVKHWLFFEKSAIVSEEIGEQEGTFIQLNADSIECGNRLLLKMFRACNYENYEKPDEELKEILMGAISPKKPDTGKKEIYFDHSPNPTQQRQIDTSVIGDCTEKQDKPVEVSTNSTTIGPGDNKNLEKKSTYRRRNKRYQPKNGKKDNGEEAANKLSKSSYCSLPKQISRRSSTLSLNSQPLSMSRNSSQLSLNSIDSYAKKKRKNRNRKPKDRNLQKDEMAAAVGISKIESNEFSDQEPTDSETLPMVEEDPEDKRFNERLRRLKIETHGYLRNN
ncbi:unnamed protein product [Caenorhabditis brenneri]